VRRRALGVLPVALRKIVAKCAEEAEPHAMATSVTGAPGGHWQWLTLIGALALDGICAAMAAATSAAVFRAFVTEALVPALRDRPGAIVVMDNLAVHKAACVREALDRAGIGHRYLPAYSPDMNPIEQTWSKLKARPRVDAARSREALDRAITGQDARGWFRHAGYRPN
jgi:transposase